MVKPHQARLSPASEMSLDETSLPEVKGPFSGLSHTSGSLLHLIFAPTAFSFIISLADNSHLFFHSLALKNIHYSSSQLAFNPRSAPELQAFFFFFFLAIVGVVTAEAVDVFPSSKFSVSPDSQLLLCAVLS